MQSLFKWVIFYSLFLFLSMQKGKLGTAIQALSANLQLYVAYSLKSTLQRPFITLQSLTGKVQVFHREFPV